MALNPAAAAAWALSSNRTDPKVPLHTITAPTVPRSAHRPGRSGVLHSSPVAHRTTAARAAVLLLTCATFLGSFLVARALFPDGSANNDESVYLFQSQLLRQGDLSLPADENTEFFRPWMSGLTDGRVVMVFPPVFPAALAASDLLTGSTQVAVALFAAGCVPLVFALARDLLDDERSGVVAAALFSLSPLVVVHSGLTLSYLLATLLELGVLVLVVRARARWRDDQPRRADRRLVAAGVLHGVLFFARPLEAMVLAVVVVTFLAVETGLRSAHQRRMLLAALVRIGLGAAPVVALSLAYNAALTGQPLRFPLWSTGGRNELGFGPRNIAAGSPTTQFDPADAWLALRANLRAFPHWFAGGLASVAFAVIGLRRLVVERRRGALAVLATLGVLVPTAYFFYWGNLLIALDGRDLYGPHYYLAMLIPACVLTAGGVTSALDAVGSRAHGNGRSLRLARAGVAALLVLGTGIEIGPKIEANRAVGDEIAAELDTVQTGVTAPAVVIVPVGPDGPYLLHPWGRMGNRPRPGGDIVYTVDRQGRNNDLPEIVPGRRLYRFQRVDGAVRNRPDLRELSRQRKRAYRADLSITNTTGGPVVTAYAAVGQGRGVGCVLDRASSLGRTYRV